MSIQENIQENERIRTSDKFRSLFFLNRNEHSVKDTGKETLAPGNHSILILILTPIFCTLISLIVVLGIMLYTPLVELATSNSDFVKIKEFHDFGAYEQWVISRLINEKAIISVDDLWSMQVSFYQTIVSVLIGINASVLAIAFLVIRSSSNRAAIREASEQIRIYTESSPFEKLVSKRAYKQIKKIHSQYDDSENRINELERKFQAELESQQKKIDAIVHTLSLLDDSEDCSSGQITT